MRTRIAAFDPGKFRELLLHIARRSADDPRFGATKLNKLLFYADFFHYGMHGRSITGATYQRLNRGPAPRQLLPIQRELIENADAVLVPTRYFGREQKRLIALRDPDLSLFDAGEIALVDEIVDIFRKNDATGLTSLSHQEMAWRLAPEKGDIPYEAVFLSNKPPTPDDIQRGRELASQHGWGKKAASA